MRLRVNKAGQIPHPRGKAESQNESNSPIYPGWGVVGHTIIDRRIIIRRILINLRIIHKPICAYYGTYMYIHVHNVYYDVH